ncbi:retrovirus-related pol polyprotein from transposon TNT 1-94 [Tanacetum coccineum]
MSKAKGFILPSHNTGRILLSESQRNTTDPSVAVTDSSTTNYDSADEFSVCSTPLPPLKKLDGAKPIFGPKTIKSILRSKSTFKAEALKSVIINKPSSAPAKGNKSSSASKVYSASVGKLKSVKIEDDPPLAICDIRKPICYLDSGCSRHITGVKSYLHKYVKQPGPKVVLVHLNFKTINKLAKQNLVIGLPSLVYSKDKPCSSCEKGKHHRANFKTKQISSIKKCLHLLYMDLFGPVTPRFINHEKYTLVIVDEYSRNSTLVNFCGEKGISQNFSSPYTPEQNGIAKRKNITLIEAARTMLLGSRIPNISFLHVFGCPVYIHSHKDHLGKFDKKADDGYLLGYSLVFKAFRVFNTRRQQTKETYHISFDEIPKAIKFSKPSVDNINIVESEIYPPDEYLHPDECPEPYECPERVVLETKVSSDQNDQTGQNDQPVQNDEILNDDHSEHSNHTNDEQIIDSLPNTKDIQIS